MREIAFRHCKKTFGRRRRISTPSLTLHLLEQAAIALCELVAAHQSEPGLFPLQVDLSISRANRECSELSPFGRPPIAVRGSFAYAVQHGAPSASGHMVNTKI